MDHLAQRLPWKMACAGMYLCLGLICLYQIAFGIGLLEFVKKKPCVQGDYGPPYAYRLQKVKEAVEWHGPPTSNAQLNRIHSASAYCEKCDYTATVFMVRQLTSGNLLK
jgi:hypothetical protein